MTPSEAIVELQNTYDKQLTDFQTARYVRFLQKFSLDDIGKIVEKAVEGSRLMPRIASLNEAATDLLILKPDRKSKADKSCGICSGTGWQYVNVTWKLTGDTVKAVKRCGCNDDPGMDF